MLGMTRAAATLVGVAVAGLLAWLATQVADGTTGGYWAVYGLLAGVGLTLALSQVAGGWTKWGRPRIDPSVFLIAFLPALIVVGWIAVAHQPDGNWFRGHALAWSADLGVGSFVATMGGVLEALVVGLGIVFGFTIDTTGRRPKVAAEPGYDRRAAEEPLTPDREVVESRPRRRVPLATTPAGRSEPEPEPPPRAAPPE
jgi:hypothetical protein